MKKKSKTKELSGMRNTSILKSLNEAEGKLHTAQGLIEDAVSLIAAAFVLFTTPADEIKKGKKKK